MHGLKQLILKRYNSPLYSMIITACLYMFFLLASMDEHHWDPSRFVHAGDRFVDTGKAPENLYVFDNSYGYDGQFYYRIALNPFSSRQTDCGIKIDGMVYRKQRILYPVLAWLISFGQPQFIPVALILINYLSICFIGLTGGSYVKKMDRHALWGLVFPLYAGFLFTLSRNLTEILEIAFLLPVFLFMKNRKYILATLFLSLAVLARETAMLVVVAIFLAEVFAFHKTRNMSKKWYLIVLPIIVYMAWRGWLMFPYHQDIVTSLNLKHFIGAPFRGFFSFFMETVPFSGKGNTVWFIELCLIIVFTVAVIYSLRSSKAEDYVKYSWGLYFVLIFMLTNNIWIEDWGFMRIISEYAMTGMIIMLNSKQRFVNYILCGSIASWFFMAANVLDRL